MKAPDIEQIISNENEQREIEVKRRAKDIIREIVKLTAMNEGNLKEMAALREELKTLEVQLIDPKSILGQ